MENNYSEDVHKNLKNRRFISGSWWLCFRSTGKGYWLVGILGNQLNKNPKQLSGGWRMRLELAKVF